MYLMNVPPVAAVRTEWRTCGTSRAYSLPICFSDSDTEVSTEVAPVSDKVQMIIKSLRSTQSSLEMGDKIEGNVLSRPECHPEVCKVSVRSIESKSKDPTEIHKADFSSGQYRERHSSDSDDSVDRGIEEAILEYLKEKDDHKRKAEPCTNSLQISKFPRKSSPEVSKKHSESNTFLLASDQFPKSIKVESTNAASVISMKRHIRSKPFLNEHPVKKTDFNKGTISNTAVLSRDQTHLTSKSNYTLNNVRVEETSSDSSSDDGIEEAIQRYQLEKKEQQTQRDVSKLQMHKEESDSTSDDGIEEAIQRYQLEQLREKSVLKSFLHQEHLASKSLTPMSGRTDIEYSKRPKLKKKKNRTEREAKLVPPPHSMEEVSKTTQSESQHGNGLLPFKVERFMEVQISNPTKVNTTAELMCAEAILDISKAVMPVGFQHDLDQSSCLHSESLGLNVHHKIDGGSDSSIDSEDGIEQEIRNFLEQKAQMQQPLSGSIVRESGCVIESDKPKQKQLTAEKKPHRLSLTRKRKIADEVCTVSKELHMDRQMKESGLLVLTQRNQAQDRIGLQNIEQSGDKSSSLDSDEDLDTAIKDLLKTKKRSKKKTKDLKRKSKKCLKDEGDSIEIKNVKPYVISKHCDLKNSKGDMTGKGKFSKDILQYKHTHKTTEQGMQKGETHKLKGGKSQVIPSLPSTWTTLQTHEDSSSVDSDDSIELEIQKFLSEKAKVSKPDKIENASVSSTSSTATCTLSQVKAIIAENQMTRSLHNCVSPFGSQSPFCTRATATYEGPIPLPQISMIETPVSTVTPARCFSSILSNSPRLLEPADGAGAARAEQWRSNCGSSSVKDINPELSKTPKPLPSAAISHSQSMKWRQSLGLPTTCLKRPSRNPFQVTSSKSSDTLPPALHIPSPAVNTKPQSPVSAWSAGRNKRPLGSLLFTSGKGVNKTFCSSLFSLKSATRPRSLTPFAQNPAPRACPTESETKSTVHMSKDQSVFVELETNRTNHVQVRSREMSKGPERQEVASERGCGASKSIDGKGVNHESADEDFVDETDCESGSSSQEKKQGFSDL